MENAADALKIAFAVLIFVIAITMTFMLISQAKSTADAVLFMGDKTNYYAYYPGVTEEGRKVSIDTVISTVYKYYKESFWVTIKDKTGKLIAEFNLENDNGTPWVGSIENINKSIGWFINEIPTDGEINGQPVIIGGTDASGNRGQKVSGNYSIANQSLLGHMNSTFIETFDEITYSGKYMVDEKNGEKITITPGYTRIHIIYTEQ